MRVDFEKKLTITEFNEILTTKDIKSTTELRSTDNQHIVAIYLVNGMTLYVVPVGCNITYVLQGFVEV